MIFIYIIIHLLILSGHNLFELLIYFKVDLGLDQTVDDVTCKFYSQI